ncbi:hypothetical protein I3843_01G244200 [Carya illinoinensis]|uniref:Uncharacterized protein n=1 Tax=Carya illinoinensis TaxID=32201 RepID=A0A8T1RRJ1_CARIL|nr:uncharacterized protein LOC122284873 [Carya illinoinensis]KAG2729428.1 hypothetical protein I3760_01G249100 [Carya illinoinensis]KAG6669554.1 hypothetical protein CIPAW_01G252200 [Carya illinoinensis]KAG6734059.1 hypothetical protein I3842_01G253800 [Carya illinoinensis]KAG7998156.1 hypothetical protein I3843_01G244200 [Carya illinoinensis]
MGNSFVLQTKAIKIMKTDGKVLRYKAPMKVQQVLSEFPGHAISDTLPVLRHLKPETKLLRDHVYHLVPLPLPSPKVGKKKKVRFANPEGEEVQESGVVRIKLIITKKELLEILEKGVDSVGEKVSQLQSKSCTGGAGEYAGDNNCRGWMPDLESIPEAS